MLIGDFNSGFIESLFDRLRNIHFDFAMIFGVGPNA